MLGGASADRSSVRRGGRRVRRPGSGPSGGCVDRGLGGRRRDGRSRGAVTGSGTRTGPGLAGGGPGSRIFDVACNGTALLKNFDILGEGGGAPVVKTFDHVQPTAQGKLELSFTPVMNYPVISAIEVVPEP